MAGTRQKAKRSTGGKVQRKQLAVAAARKTKPGTTRVNTNKRWTIWSVVDRRGSPGAYQYRVMWLLPRNRKKRGQATWEPRVWLLNECASLSDDLDVINAFRSCAEQHPQPREPLKFEIYCKESGIPLSIRTSPGGRCGFDALRAAARVAGAVSWSPAAVVDEFLASRTRNPGNAEEVVVWTTLLRFVKFANVQARAQGLPDLSQDILNRNLFVGSVAGRRALDYIASMGLPIGVYVCAGAFPLPKRLAHAFMLEVEPADLFATDAETTRQPLDEFLGDWLESLLFVRRVELMS